jgi:hypothetical protein
MKIMLCIFLITHLFHSSIPLCYILNSALNSTSNFALNSTSTPLHEIMTEPSPRAFLKERKIKRNVSNVSQSHPLPTTHPTPSPEAFLKKKNEKKH